MGKRGPEGQTTLLPNRAQLRSRVGAFLLLASLTACSTGQTDNDEQPARPAHTVERSPAQADAQDDNIMDTFPDEKTTGVSDSVELEQSDSVITSNDGQVIENLEVTGAISVEHNSVTIRNVRVNGTGHYGIAVPHELSDQITDLVIEDTEIVGVSGPRSAGIAPFGSWTARRVNVSGFEDGIKIGSNQIIEDSFIHSLYTPPDSHADGIQSTGGTDVVIRGNRIEGPWQGQTSAIILQSNDSPVESHTIEGNLLSGGTYTMYLRDKGTGHGAPSEMIVRDNIWVSESWLHGPISIDRDPGWTWDNNQTDSDELID